MGFGLTEADLDRRRKYVELRTQLMNISPDVHDEWYNSVASEGDRLRIRILLEGDGDWLHRTDARLDTYQQIKEKILEVKQLTRQYQDEDLNNFVGATLDGGRDSSDPYYDYFEGEHAGVLDAIELFIAEGGPE